MILTVTLNPAIDKVYEVDSFQVGDVFRPNDMWAMAGGKGLNVSRVASILGGDVVATGFLGGGNGQFIRKRLGKQGIKDAFIEIEGETRICIAVNDPILDTSTEVLEPGPVISLSEQEDFLKNFQSLAKGADIVTMSGSLPDGLPSDYYGRLIEICRGLGKRVILDTSGETLEKSLLYSPFMIKPNQTELGAITGTPIEDETQILSTAHRLQQGGIDLVCITLGGSGSIVVSKEGAYRLKSPPIETVSAIGSGDAFVAGCAFAFDKGRTTKDVLKMGMACGMANTQFARTGHVSLELVEKFYDMITVLEYDKDSL